MARGRFVPALPLALVIGCGPSLAENPDADTQAGTGSETDVSACDAACAASCETMLSECEEPLTGTCTVHDVCECVEFQACKPCIAEQCPTWEGCMSEFASCMPLCNAEIPAIIDPPGSCEIPISPAIPIQVIPYTQIYLDDVLAAYNEDCADPNSGDWSWTWLVVGQTIRLCDALCAEFEAGVPFVGWSVIGCAEWGSPP